MIVLDASVLIAHFDSNDTLHPRATELLLACSEDRLAASPITMAEILVGPARSHRLDTALRAMDDLGVATLPWHDDGPPRLATLRANTGLRLPDCCVLLAAESEGAAVATFDERLATAARSLGLDLRS